MKKRLLVMASTFPRWKNDTIPPFVYELSKRLTKDFDVSVLAPYSKGSKKHEASDRMKIFRFKYWFDKEQNLADGAILPSLKKNKFLWLQVPFFVLSEFVNMLKICKKEQIDAIHAHWIIPQGFLAVLYKKIFNKKIKIVITTHGSDIFCIKFANPIKKWVVNNCSVLTVVSNAIKKEVVKLGIKKEVPVEIISMGVDLSKFNPSKYDESIKKRYGINGPFLLFVGRLSEKKGVKYLIEAMSGIVKRFPNVKLLIIGDGEEKDNLLKQAKKTGLFNKNIIFTGAIPNSELPKYYATADIFIGPSIVGKRGDTEGFGLVFVEAIGSGCATIGTDLPAISDIIIDGKTGFIVKQKSSEGISNKVIELLENKKLHEIIKKEGREYVLNKFDWNIIKNKYGDVIK
jgi:glycosyltransferase involved in cell wall biosynthesis